MAYDRPIPQRGETWRHYNGSLAVVLYLADHPSDALRSVVVYECNKNRGQVWFRDLKEWMGEVKPPLPASVADRPGAAEPVAGQPIYRFIPAPPPEGEECDECEAPATEWDGFRPLCERCGECMRIPF